MPSDSQRETIIELCGQNGPENLCHMTHILLQNFRDLLCPSFGLKYTLYMRDTPKYGFRSDVTKFEPDLTCLATVRAQSVNMLHMSIILTLTDVGCSR